MKKCAGKFVHSCTPIVALSLCLTGALRSTGNAQDDKSALNLWAAQIDPSTIRFAWNEMPGAVSYTISCDIGTRPRRTLGTIAGGTASKTGGVPRRLSYVLAVRDPSTPHRCFLQLNVDPKAQASEGIPFNVVTPVRVLSTVTKPPEPSVTAQSSAPGEITVTWNEVPNATAYTIGRYVAPNGYSMFCDLCPATTTIVDKYAVAGAKHKYTVTPITPAGQTPRGISNEVVAARSTDEVVMSADAGLDPNVTSPRNVQAVATAATTIAVSWESVDAAAGYDVYRSVNDGPYTRIGHTGSGALRTTIQFPDYIGGLLTSTILQLSVRYAVRSIDAGGHATEPASSNTVVIDNKAGVPGTSTSTNASNTKAVATSANSVTLTWSPPIGSIPCALRRSLDGGAFAAMPPIAVNATTYIDSAEGLMSHRPRYQIVCSTPKAALPAVAFPNPIWDSRLAPTTATGSSGITPTNLNATATSADSVRLTWGPPTTPVACTVQRSTDGKTYATLATLPIGAFQYVDTSNGLMTLRPRYQLLCGDPKAGAVPVKFPTPVAPV